MREAVKFLSALISNIRDIALCEQLRENHLKFLSALTSNIRDIALCEQLRENHSEFLLALTRVTNKEDRVSFPAAAAA